MTVGTYRDGEDATLQVLERLEAEVARREQRLDARTVRFLGEDSARLAESRRKVEALAVEEAEPLARVKAVERHLAVLDEVLARLPALNRVLSAARPGFPSLEMFRIYSPMEDFAKMPLWVGATFRNVERFITRFDLDFLAWSLNSPGRRGFKVEFRHQGVPLVLGCEKGVSQDGAAVMGEHSVVATRVPRGTPDLAVVPERLHHTLLFKPLGLVTDMHVGDDRFDHEFLVQSEHADALEVVNKEVRRGLLEIKKSESPQLLVEEGDAAVHWFSEPSHALIRAAMKVLRALRGGAAELA